MTTPTPRVLMQSTATKGEVFRVKTIINHQMETGLRHDAQDRVIPRRRRAAGGGPDVGDHRGAGQLLAGRQPPRVAPETTP